MKKRVLPFAIVLLGVMLGASHATAQQRLGYIDSEFMLNQIPEFASVQQNIDRMAQEWQADLESLQQGVDELFREYQARELLYTQEERLRKQEEIMRRESELDQFRARHFGPEGELFRQQELLMRPIQERIIHAVEEVAKAGGYDFIFDKSGDYMFLYARDQHDVTLRVLSEMGIDVDRISGRN